MFHMHWRKFKALRVCSNLRSEDSLEVNCLMASYIPVQIAIRQASESKNARRVLKQTKKTRRDLFPSFSKRAGTLKHHSSAPNAWYPT